MAVAVSNARADREGDLQASFGGKTRMLLYWHSRAGQYGIEGIRFGPTRTLVH